MKKYLRPWLMGLWMGVALYLFGNLNYTQWEFYAILLPTIFITAIVYQD